MRALRPVAPQETLVCWGAYQYFKDRRPTGVTEEWSLHRLPDGTEVARADVDARKVADAFDWLTHFVRDADGRPQELIVQYRKGALYAKATYAFQRDRVEITRDVGDMSTRREALDIASGYVVDYRAIIASDYTWRGYPQYMQGAVYAVPIFQLAIEPEEMPDLLGGNVTRVNVQPLEAASLTIPPGVYADVRRYQVALSDDREAVGWFDQHGIPLRWSRPDDGYEFVLMRYRHQEKGEESKTE
jgi:hypothetical protein